MRAAFDGDGRAAARAAADLPQRRSRTAAAWARRRPRSSAGLSRWPAAWSPAAELLLDDDALLRLAAGSRVTPTTSRRRCFGGFVIAGPRRRRRSTPCRPPVDPRIGAVVFVPPDPVSTELARGLLPAEVPHADAAANAGRAALLVAALAGQPELLLRGHRATGCTRTTAAGDAGVARAGRRAARRRRRRGRLRRRPDGARLHRRRHGRGADLLATAARTAGTRATSTSTAGGASADELTSRCRCDTVSGPR